MLAESGLLIALVRWTVSALALVITAYVIPGIEVKNFPSALLAAFIIGVLNMLIWPFLIIITLPINILTLGLFTFVVNAIILRICASFLKGFNISGWFPAILGALVLAIVSGLLHTLIV